MQAKLTITPTLSAVVRHADGTVTDLGDVSNPSWRTRWKLYQLRRRQRRNQES